MYNVLKPVFQNCSLRPIDVQSDDIIYNDDINLFFLDHDPTLDLLEGLALQ